MPFYGPLAHAWLEQRTHNPLVLGSTPRGATIENPPQTHHAPAQPKWFKPGLLALGLSLFPAITLAEGTQTGASLMGMCNGGDKVRSLAVMCHSYTNGYIDAANYYAVKQHGKPLFCIDEKRKKRVPLLITSRIKAQPALTKEPATAILHTLFSQNFACK